MQTRKIIGALVLGVGVATGVTAAPAATAVSASPQTGELFVIQGLLGTTLDITVDGSSVADNAAAKDVVGPVTLPPGDHTLNATGAGGTATASFTVKAGESLDVVVHRQVDPTKPPLVTSFPNDLSPVGAGKGRVSVTHTAAVGPADIRVDGKVAFANVANGESLNLVVPATSYSVDIVPTATTGPVVFGPATLPVKETALTRVFAIGVAADRTMDAVIQVLPLPQRGSSVPPSAVQAGTGGQVAPLTATPERSAVDLFLMGIAFLAACAAVVALRRGGRPPREAGIAR